MIRCCGRLKGSFNSFLPHQMGRDTAGPTGGDGEGRSVCHLRPVLCQGPLLGEGARRIHVLGVKQHFTAFRIHRAPHTFLTLWDRRSLCCPGRAHESLPEERGCPPLRPSEVPGKQEQPAGKLRGQSLSFKPSTCLSLRKAPRGTDWTPRCRRGD